MSPPPVFLPRGKKSPFLTPFLPVSSPYPLIPRGGEVISLIHKFGTNNPLTSNTASPFSIQRGLLVVSSPLPGRAPCWPDLSQGHCSLVPGLPTVCVFCTPDSVHTAPLCPPMATATKRCALLINATVYLQARQGSKLYMRIISWAVLLPRTVLETSQGLLVG